MALPAAIRMTVALHLDDDPVPGFPIERRVMGTMLEHFDFVREADGVGVLTSEAVPVDFLPANTMLFLTDAPIRLAVNGPVQDGLNDLGLRAGAALLFALAEISTLATTNATVTPAQITVLTLKT